MKTISLVLALLAAPPTLAPELAHAQAHEHGAARLDVSVEGKTVSLQFEAPLDALFGFERAPRSAAEKALVDAGIARLKAADRLFQFDAAADCRLASVALTSAALKLGAAAPAAALSAEHADLEATFEFACRSATLPGTMDIALFGAFPRLQRIDIQVATPQGQFKRSLKRPTTRISLRR
ncbi:MAG: DUF2796 domain-containing protein [Burkholderiaceae bacterium]